MALTVGPEELYVLSFLQSAGKNVLFVEAMKASAMKAAVLYTYSWVVLNQFSDEESQPA